MKPLIIYHKATPEHDCPDGICAARIVALAMGYNNVEVVGETHRSKDGWKRYQPPYKYAGRKVIMVDFFSPQLGAELAKRVRSLKVLDHHVGIKDDLLNLSNSFYFVTQNYSPSNEDCASTIAWKTYFRDKPEPWYLKSVYARDTGAYGYYQGQCKNLEAIASELSVMRSGKSGAEAFPVYDLLDSYTSEQIKLFIECGMVSVNNKDNLSMAEVEDWEANPEFLSLRELAEEYGYLIDAEENLIYTKVPFLQIKNKEARHHYSWVGHYLGEAMPDQPFLIVQTAPDVAAFSLRKPIKSHINLSRVARIMGGGGHASASGFML